MKQQLLYSDLVSWYHLIDATRDHEDEARAYVAAFDRVLSTIEAPTLLELGSGAGNNASFMKRRFPKSTLSDLSEPMIALSRTLNPECEHIAGSGADMRTLRLEGRTFDAVFVHDSIVYMHTEDDLRAAMQTAFIHTRPGGAAVFAPDYVRETFTEVNNIHRGDDNADGSLRALRCLEWTWDPDPSDTTYTVEYAFLLRDRDGSMTAVHDRHIEGMFPRATWTRLLESVGFRSVTSIPRDDLEGEEGFCEMFLCVR